MKSLGRGGPGRSRAGGRLAPAAAVAVVARSPSDACLERVAEGVVGAEAAERGDLADGDAGGGEKRFGAHDPDRRDFLEDRVPSCLAESNLGETPRAGQPRSHFCGGQPLRRALAYPFENGGKVAALALERAGGAAADDLDRSEDAAVFPLGPEIVQQKVPAFADR